MSGSAVPLLAVLAIAACAALTAVQSAYAADAPDGLSPGAIAVADTGSHTVRIFNASGALVIELGSRGGGGAPLGDAVRFASPEGVALADDGMIAVADTGNDRIVVFNPDGTMAYEFGKEGGGVGEFDGPRAVAFVPWGGMLAVADTGNHRVQVFHPWQSQKVFAKSFWCNNNSTH